MYGNYWKGKKKKTNTYPSSTRKLATATKSTKMINAQGLQGVHVPAIHLGTMPLPLQAKRYIWKWALTLCYIYTMMVK